MLQYIECIKDRKDFAVLSGNDALILKRLQAGGHGGVAGGANIYPHTMTSIYNKFIEGNIEET